MLYAVDAETPLSEQQLFVAGFDVGTSVDGMDCICRVGEARLA